MKGVFRMNDTYLKIGENFPKGNPYLNTYTRKLFQYKMNTLNYDIEDKVKYCLSLFGWTGEKRPQAEQIFQDMAQFHYYIFPAGRIFIERFGGLQIKNTVEDLVFPYKYSFDIEDFVFCEALQIFKNELLIPIVSLDDEMYIFLGESGRVHYWVSDVTGILPDNMFSVLASLVFFLEKYTFVWMIPEGEGQKTLWWDQNIMDCIENEFYNGTYVTYAQKRFAKNGGVPNPMTGKDAFTQWLFSLDER